MSWGPRAAFIYNDAYVQVLGPAKHPWALGCPAEEVWAEIWDVCGPLARQSVPAWRSQLRGRRSAVHEPRRTSLKKRTYHQFYKPLQPDSATRPAASPACSGPSAETTHKVLNARRLARTLSELAAKALVERSVETACASAIDTLGKNPDDVPVCPALLDRSRASPGRAQSQSPAWPTAMMNAPRPSWISTAEGALWPVQEVVETCQPRRVRIEPANHLPLGPAARADRRSACWCRSCPAARINPPRF